MHLLASTNYWFTTSQNYISDFPCICELLICTTLCVIPSFLSGSAGTAGCVFEILHLMIEAWPTSSECHMRKITPTFHRFAHSSTMPTIATCAPKQVVGLLSSRLCVLRQRFYYRSFLHGVEASCWSLRGAKRYYPIQVQLLKDVHTSRLSDIQLVIQRDSCLLVALRLLLRIFI